MTIASSPQDVAQARRCCALAARLRDSLRDLVAPGVETRELDEQAARMLAAWGAKSWFKGYRGYPAHVCLSVNEEVVHGIPGRRKLLPGDLVSIDVGVLYEGFHADTALCQPVGDPGPEAARLLRVTREALDAGIAEARSGRRVGDISHAIQRHVEAAGFSVVREFVGHGIGRREHEDPQIPNYGSPGRGMVLQPGQMLAIEPMVNEGAPAVQVREDGWTAVTADGKRSAHFEHTVLVTGGAPEILTAAGGGARA